DQPACPAAIVDHDRLPEARAQMLRDNSRDPISCTAGCVRDNEMHGSSGIILSHGWNSAENRAANGQSHQQSTELQMHRSTDSTSRSDTIESTTGPISRSSQPSSRLPAATCGVKITFLARRSG